MAGLRSSESHLDRLFDKALSMKYNLSIRFQPDGLFYSIYDPDENKYLGFEWSIHSGISDIFRFLNNHEWLTKRFKNTLCVIPSSKYTLVPSALFLPDKAHDYLSFVHDLLPGEQIGISDLKSEDAKIIYASDTGFFEIIREHFPSAFILPGISALIDHIIPAYRNQSGSVLTICLNNSNFDLLLLQDGKLLYSNNFSFSNSEDLVYYVIFIIDQLKVNTEKVKVLLCGEISEKSETMRLMKKYVRNVDLLSVKNQVQLSYALNDVSLFKYPDLFNPLLCEL